MTNRVFLGAIMVVALAFRLYLGVDAPYIHDEDNNAIPLANTISFQPGAVHLPLRGENHGALPAYVVKVSSLLFGESRLGYRALHILLSLVTVLLVYRLTNDWYGPVAARWAAALLAFNEYYLPISARATAHVPYLLLVVIALYAFSRFLSSQKPAWLYGAGAAVGLAFYCKEHAALLVPVFLLTMLHPRLRHWLRRPQPYVAALVFTAFLAPDFYWNATTSPETIVNYGNQPALQARYSNHLRRVGGIGFSPYPMMFYARRAVMPIYDVVMGRELIDETKEYSSINPALGLLLVGSVITTALARRKDLLSPFLLIAFGFVFLLFTFISRGDPPGRLDPVSWIWVESTMFPAIVLTGTVLAGAGSRTRVALWAIAGVALVYGVAQVLLAAFVV